jgi:hypothetical protein
MEFLFKALISGLIVATVSSLSLKNATIAAVVMGIPFTALLSMAFMYYNGVDSNTFAQFSFQTIYFVLTSLVFFVIFGLGIGKLGFWPSMGLGILVTIILFNIVLRIL